MVRLFQPLPCSPNSNSIAQAAGDAVKSPKIKRNSVFSDAAKYIMAACATLKSLYPELFRVTFVAHLLHNFAIKFKFLLKNVDQLVATVKSATVENKS